MEIRRTANAGVLLTLDDAKILLDGVCREVSPYPATPLKIKEELISNPPDVLLFTHNHADHFDPDYCQDVDKPLLTCPNTMAVGKVKITSVFTRHMGHYGKTTPHQSFVVEGSKCVWFLGDASPTELRKLAEFPKPDILMIPYPYVSTPAALKMVEVLLPCKIVLLHMPFPDNDPEKIWQTVQDGMEHLKAYLYVPKLGETLNF